MFIDPFQSDWLTALRERVAELSEQVHVYLLLDGVFVPGLYKTPPFANNAAGPVSLLFTALPGFTDEVKDVSPFLVQIKNAGMSRMDGLPLQLTRCSGAPMVSVIATTESQEQLGDRLAAWSVIENDGQRFNFRYPDTRRLPGIYRAMHVEQRAQFCGPMSFWMYMDRDGRWGDLDVITQPSDIASLPVLDDEQFGIMVSDSAADEVLFRLVYGGLKVDLLPSVLYKRVQSALITAHGAELGPLLDEWCEYVINNGGQSGNPLSVAEWRASTTDT